MTNTIIIREYMDDFSMVDHEFADTTPFDELNAAAFRFVEEHAKYDWYCERVSIGFMTDEGDFQEIWNADFDKRDAISEEFADELALADDFDDYDEPDFDLECGFDPYEGCYTWDC